MPLKMPKWGQFLIVCCFWTVARAPIVCWIHASPSTRASYCEAYRRLCKICECACAGLHEWIDVGRRPRLYGQIKGPAWVPAVDLTDVTPYVIPFQPAGWLPRSNLRHQRCRLLNCVVVEQIAYSAGISIVS
ncbi:hypothetical protein BR93DRAFT_736134 [Coniochaeta sp. PMI_546]|nr:hypothetical protein BR93DRAFT_736134 [Coniochaeta sp. PMI_546]